MFRLSVLLLLACASASAQSLPRLRVSDNRRFLVDASGKPFFYLADTAWELFHRLTRMLPAWGRWVTDDRVITAKNAQSYGEFLGRQYGRKGVIWVLGGDRTATGFEDVWRNLARGIAIGVSGKADYSAVLLTFHPRGGETSSTWFHNDNWLDFNMQQNGHNTAAARQVWTHIARDYNLTPTKPVIDGEPPGGSSNPAPSWPACRTSPCWWTNSPARTAAAPPPLLTLSQIREPASSSQRRLVQRLGPHSGRRLEALPRARAGLRQASRLLNRT